MMGANSWIKFSKDGKIQKLNPSSKSSKDATFGTKQVQTNQNRTREAKWGNMKDWNR
jgi:hypothetical protein